MASQKLPKHVRLKSVFLGNYIRYVHEVEEVRGFIKCDCDDVRSPYAKFTVERAKSGNGLVNIKCSYNNKYLRMIDSTDRWIVAEEMKPIEDRNSWKCTLFAYTNVPNTNDNVQLRHVQRNGWVRLTRAQPVPKYACLEITPTKDYDNKCSVFSFTDADLLLSLPRYIAFKGSNGLYLAAHEEGGSNYLKFSSDKKDRRVAMEVRTSKKGQVLILSSYFGKYWYLSHDNFILADEHEVEDDKKDPTEEITDPSAFFIPELDPRTNVVYLRSVGNNNFCVMQTLHNVKDCLVASFDGGSNATRPRLGRLIMEEFISATTIIDVEYDDKERIEYIEERELPGAVADTVNLQSKGDIKKIVTYSYECLWQRTWTITNSILLGVNASLKAAIPFVAEGGFEVKAENNFTFSWADTKSEKQTLTDSTEVTVPPRHVGMVKVKAVLAHSDIPFSYKRLNTLPDASTVLSDIHQDGYSKGYKFVKFDVKVLPPKPLPNIPPPKPKGEQ